MLTDCLAIALVLLGILLLLITAAAIDHLLEHTFRPRRWERRRERRIYDRIR